MSETTVKGQKLEVIMHASVKSVDGWLFIGKCHGDCFHKAHNVGIKMSPKADDQGFITSLGRYVDRGEAMDIAFATGQVDIDSGYLFSEDLWCPTYNGKYEYSETDGYFLRGEAQCRLRELCDDV